MILHQLKKYTHDQTLDYAHVIRPVMLESKKIGNDHTLIQSKSTSRPQTNRERITHTIQSSFTKDTHGKPNESFFPYRWSFSSRNWKQQQYRFLPIFKFKYQNKSKQEADWAAAIQVTILLETIYKRT